jgi:hypothetical protein
MTAESTIPRDDCWKGLVKKLGGRFRSASVIRGRTALLKERRGKTWGPDRETVGPNNGLVYAKRLRRSMKERLVVEVEKRNERWMPTYDAEYG